MTFFWFWMVWRAPHKFHFCSKRPFQLNKLISNWFYLTLKGLSLAKNFYSLVLKNYFSFSFIVRCDMFRVVRKSQRSTIFGTILPWKTLVKLLFNNGFKKLLETSFELSELMSGILPNAWKKKTVLWLHLIFFDECQIK